MMKMKNNKPNNRFRVKTLMINNKKRKWQRKKK